MALTGWGLKGVLSSVSCSEHLMYRASQSERAECPTAVQHCLNNTFSFIRYNIILYSLCIIWNMDRDFPYWASAPGEVPPPSPIKQNSILLRIVKLFPKIESGGREGIIFLMTSCSNSVLTAKVHMLLPSEQKPGCLPDLCRNLFTSVPSTQAYALGDWTCYKEALERH